MDIITTTHEVSDNKFLLIGIIDRYAESGGALLSLVCDTLVMPVTAYLTPFDPLMQNDGSFDITYNQIKILNGTDKDLWLPVTEYYGSKSKKRLLGIINDISQIQNWSISKKEFIIRNFVSGSDYVHSRRFRKDELVRMGIDVI